MRLGAVFSKVKNWGVHTVTDGLLITGQNPASSGPTAKIVVDRLTKKAAKAKTSPPAAAA
jgi:putative intracellular protease/amidase